MILTFTRKIPQASIVTPQISMFPTPQAIAQEDLQRGYWDDFKQLKDEGGKMFQAADRLTAADVASAFPSFQARASH